MNSALFLLAVPALLLQGAYGLESAEVSTDRNNIRGRRLDEMAEWDSTWGYQLGKCAGSACGGFGDPHLITCDGLFYDCQGIGIFTLMENDVFNIQATFVDVGAEEKAETASWMTQGASIANDLMIQYTPPEGTAPVLQFGVGDIEDHDGTYIAEGGCEVMTYYHEYLDYSFEPDVESCRASCEDYDNCDKFSYWYDGWCFFHEAWANKYVTDVGWTRSVAGDLDGSCGVHTEEDKLLLTEEENAKATRIGRGCPLLMFVDGEMIDISDVFYEGDLYGQEGDDIHAAILWGWFIHVTYKLENGDYAVIELSQGGMGLGELWSCHLDFWICLPESDKDHWAESTIGLLGSPDHDTQNDWMLADGTVIDVGLDYDATQEEFDESMINYCYDNWCVGHDDSLMTYHGDHTFEDYKCEEKEYVEIVDRDCVLTIDKIIDTCKHMPPLMIHACEVDCCFGGCNQIEEVLEQIEEIKLLSVFEDEGDILYDIPDFDKCDGENFDDTSDTVCGNGVEAVTLLKISGSEELPDGEIFFGINLHSEPSIEVGHRTVKFKVNNPFPDTADVYVKYEKAVMDDMADPNCAPMIGVASGCDANAVDIEVLCRTFDGVDPFAVVQVYFVSESISSEDSPTIDSCCHPEEFGAESGIVAYTFEVACECPFERIA